MSCNIIMTYADQWENHRMETFKGPLSQVPLNGSAVFWTLISSQVEDGAHRVDLFFTYVGRLSCPGEQFF